MLISEDLTACENPARARSFDRNRVVVDEPVLNRASQKPGRHQSTNAAGSTTLIGRRMRASNHRDSFVLPRSSGLRASAAICIRPRERAQLPRTTPHCWGNMRRCQRTDLSKGTPDGHDEEGWRA